MTSDGARNRAHFEAVLLYAQRVTDVAVNSPDCLHLKSSKQSCARCLTSPRFAALRIRSSTRCFWNDFEVETRNVHLSTHLLGPDPSSSPQRDDSCYGLYVLHAAMFFRLALPMPRPFYVWMSLTSLGRISGMVEAWSTLVIHGTLVTACFSSALLFPCVCYSM